MTIEMVQSDGWADDFYYICGFVRPIPDVRSFVFPVLTHSRRPERLLVCLEENNGSRLIEVEDRQDIVFVHPVRLCDEASIKSYLPIYAFEHEASGCCFGSATAVLRFFCSPSNRLTGASLAGMQRLLAHVHSDQYQGRSEGFFAVSAFSGRFMRPPPWGTVVKVMGVGDVGIALVGRLASAEVKLDLICANTNRESLARLDGVRQLPLGRTSLAAAKSPERGRSAAMESESDIRSVLQGTGLLFIAAGLGGGTGAGAVPFIAEVAREMGIVVVGLVARPVDWDSSSSYQRRRHALAQIDEACHSVVIIPASEADVEDKFSPTGSVDWLAHVLANAVQGVSDILNVPGHVNVDFDDVRTVLQERGRAVIGVGEADGADRAQTAAERAVSTPLSRDLSLGSARGVLVLITAAKGSLRLSETKLALNTIRAYASRDAHVIYGTAYNDGLGDTIRVTLVASGLSEQERSRPPAFTVLRTHERLLSRAGFAVGGGTLQRNVPSIWRTNRSVIVRSSEDEAYEEFEIPEFLRKQVK